MNPQTPQNPSCKVQEAAQNALNSWNEQKSTVTLVM